ncbi:SusC/RagA family TonB-linked outer membrane protein [Echinicola rosea]|uniref:SusC/RagA family TonB-linked outer membrane protein n=2 Tax=Echinicola rosea TaxID=1807691 RepID=A0ABQ1UQL0_9BACT|nr:SusC/RagA family TonB-linked outer membrane protein [Echinicola rosea]
MKLTHLGQGGQGVSFAPPNYLLVMKWTLILCLSLVFQVTAKVHSQDLTLKAQGLPLIEVMEMIESQSEYRFVFNDETVSQSRPVYVDVKSGSLETILTEIFSHQPFTYQLVETYIVIKPKTTDDPAAITVTGTVISTDGEPLPGATVRVKGGSKGTVTDLDGKFTFNGLSENAILVISFIGYDPVEIPVDGRSKIAVTLRPSENDLSEIVVIGYGQQDRKEVTSAISNFRPDEKNFRQVLGPDQMMQGRMPGVHVGAGAGTPGSNVRVSIRGIGSLSGQNEPLYVVDGIPLVNHNAALFNLGEGMNPLSELNPNDIESIEVLKDAASAAIYGSRATNGVVIITTKSGKVGQSSLNIQTNFGVQYLPNLDKLKMADSDLYLEVLNEARFNYNEQNGYSPGDGNFVDYMEDPYPGLPDTDWLDLVLRDALVSNVNVSFSSGSEKTKLYISGGYLNQEGVLKTNDYKKYNAKVNVTHQAVNWLEIGTNTNLSFSRNHRVPNGTYGSSVFLRSMGQRPFDRPYKPNGDYYVGGTDELVYHNNLQIINEQNTKLDNYRMLGNAYADIKFSPSFHLKNTFGLDAIYTEDYLYYTDEHPYGAGQGRLLDERRMMTNGLVENTLYFDHTFGKLTVNALVGHSYQKVTTSTNYIDGRGFPSPSFDVLSVASEIANASSGFGENALESYYSRANLSWEDKYLLSLSIRADGSSKFSPEKRYGSFPSISAGWNVSDEDFWKFSQTDLKLRASYGATGNQDGIGSYAYQALMSGGANYGGNSGLSISTFGNPNLTWETANQFDVGIDLGLWSGKANISADYFIKNTENLLYNMPIHATSGFSSVTSNIGSMRNTGLEFLFDYNQQFGELQWQSSFNISFVQNELTSLLGDDPLLIGANRTLQVGEEVGSFYMYKMLGIFQTDEEVPEQLYDQGVRAGDVHYEDVNGDGIINVDDRQIIGTSNPDFYGGWSNTFQYKNFDLSAFLTFSQGSEIYATWRITTDRLGNGRQGFREEPALERWTGPGTSNEVPRAIHGTGYNTYNSSRFLEDASFLRLRTLSLGYSLPQSILDKLQMSKLRVFVQGENLYLFSNYSGLDPEVSKNYDARFMADDNMNLPQPRTIRLGINAAF